MPGPVRGTWGCAIQKLGRYTNIEHLQGAVRGLEEQREGSSIGKGLEQEVALEMCLEEQVRYGWQKYEGND